MSMNPNWPRWIVASIVKHFDAARGDLYLHVEGQKRNTRELDDFIELRVDGPYSTEVSRGYWYLFLEVNVLIQSNITDNIYKIHKDVGIVCAAFTDMNIFKYGSEETDDGSFVGCLRLIQNVRDHRRIQTNHFGQVKPPLPLHQATVEGHFEVYLEE